MRLGKALALASLGITLALPAPLIWTEGPPLPVARDHHVVFLTHGTAGTFLHTTGGNTYRETLADGWRLPLREDGGFGTWQPIDSLPTSRAGLSVAVTDRSVVLVGGKLADRSNTNETLVAALRPDGSVAPWTAAPPMPGPRFHHSAVFHGGFVYVTGGLEAAVSVATVFRARVRPDGTLDAWTRDLRLGPIATGLVSAAAERAGTALAWDEAAWYIGMRGPTRPTPSVYREAIQRLRAFNTSLEQCQATFDARADNLLQFLDRIAGDMHIAVGGQLPFIVQRMEGAETVAVFSFRNTPSHRLIGTVPTLEEVEGGLVGVSAEVSADGALTEMVLESVDLTLGEDYDFLVVGGTTDRAAALESGGVPFIFTVRRTSMLS